MSGRCLDALVGALERLEERRQQPGEGIGAEHGDCNQRIGQDGVAGVVDERHAEAEDIAPAGERPGALKTRRRFDARVSADGDRGLGAACWTLSSMRRRRTDAIRPAVVRDESTSSGAALCAERRGARDRPRTRSPTAKVSTASSQARRCVGRILAVAGHRRSVAQRSGATIVTAQSPRRRGAFTARRVWISRVQQLL